MSEPPPSPSSPLTSPPGSSADTSVEPTPVQIETNAGAMPAALWVPALESGPGLLLLQEIFGVSDYIKQRGADLAALGYVVLAPEIFWRLEDSEIDESAPDFLQQALGVVGRLDWPTAVDDARAAFTWLRQLDQVSGGVGVIGFCFGGGLAFNLAAMDSPDVLVSYYGSALPHLLDLAPQVTAPSLHHFGLADAYLDPDTVMRIRAAVITQPDTVFETYGGAGHAFDNPRPEFHDETASAQAWRTTTAFLAARLPVR